MPDFNGKEKMIRKIVVRIFGDWQAFVNFLREYEDRKELENIEFHQRGPLIVVRLRTGEPDAMKRGYWPVEDEDQ
jgi:hypothetical protein